jgi:hypothetical protein
MPVNRMVGARGDHGEGRHDPLSDSPIIIAVLSVSSRSDQKTTGTFNDLEDGLGIIQIILVALRALE